MKREWWHDSVVYQIYPRSFQDSNGDGIGDLPGIITRLDYIQVLGADMIWLCPVYASPNDDNGYDISDYYSINPEYGTMDDMSRLISESGKRGIGIMMDIVANHTSDEHPWFQEASRNKDSPYSDFYVFRDPDENGNEPTQLASVFGGSAWTYNEDRGQYYLHMFSPKQPDLNWHNPNVRQAIYDILRFWIQKGIKGFRFDVIDLIAKDIDNEIIGNGPQLHPYIQEMYQAVLKDPDVVTVGEANNADVQEALLFSDQDRNELNMVFSFEHLALDEIPGQEKWDLQEINTGALKQVLSNLQYGLTDRGWNSLFWNNHDQPRIVTRWGDDQVHRYVSATMFATLLHFQKGTPYIYQGEEIGMTGVAFDTIDAYKDIETHNMYRERLEQGYAEEDIMESIYAKGRDNSRTPMQWDDSEHAGFTSGKPWLQVNSNYEGINADRDRYGSGPSIFAYYQKLIDLRKHNDVMVYGDYDLLETSDSIFAYTRHLNGEWLYVLCNLTGEPVPCEVLQKLAGYKQVIHNYPDHPPPGELRPYEAIVYCRQTT